MTQRCSNFIAAAALGTALIAASAFAAPSDTTQNFVKNAAIGGEFEVESSKIALDKTQNADIKQFAQQMIDDHTKAGDKLKATAQQAGVDNSAIPTSLDPKHQKMIDKLNTLSGKSFDKEYLKDQKAAHGEAISLFKSYSKSGDNAPLKDFAGKTLPTLESHKDHLKQVKSAS